MLPISAGHTFYTNDRMRRGYDDAMIDTSNSGENGCSAMLRGKRGKREDTAGEVFVVGDVGKEGAHILRVVHISDTADRNLQLSYIPDGDILVHSGNLTVSNKRHISLSNLSLSGSSATKQERDLQGQIDAINNFFSKMPHRYKIFVAGGNETGLEQYDRETIQKRLRDVIYLQDNGCVIEGLQFWGSPWSSQRRGKAGAFYKPSSEADGLQKTWELIPENTEVLVTHIPPYEFSELMSEIKGRIKPRLSLFGLSKDRRRIKWRDNILFCSSVADESWTDESYRQTCVPITVDFYMVLEGPYQTHLPRGFTVGPARDRSRHTSASTTSSNSSRKVKVATLNGSSGRFTSPKSPRKKCVIS